MESIVVGSIFEIVTFAVLCVLLSAALFTAGLLCYKSRELKRKVRFAFLQLRLQKERYEQLRNLIEVTEKTRHDLRHHFVSLRGLLNARDENGLRSYLEQWIGAADTEYDADVCKNHVVNAVVSHYFLLAKRSQIYTDANIDLPEEQEGVRNSDLCLVFGNCLENALEACQRMKKGEKYIHVNACTMASMLSITIDNSFDEPPQSNKKGNFFSQKRGKNELGVGLSSVRAVVQRYGGAVKFEVVGKEFRTAILFPLGGNQTAYSDL